ncbi:unnamed protein product [Linum trigynum]|uniref:PGG domain-containing protein n=1 Tax=Linum trigynum TaxID=586398 RepID=A0AAV2G8R1_9ROSI
MAMMITRDVLEVGGGGGGISYEDWSDCLQTYLLSRDLLHLVVVDEQPIPPTDGNISSTEGRCWRRENAAALHAIKISCGSGLLRQIRGITSAKQAWEAVATLYYDQGEKQQAELLLDVDQDLNVQEVNQPADEDLTELEACIRRGDIARLRDLIRRNPDSATRRFPGGRRGTGLHLAAKYGEAEVGYELMRAMREEDLEIKDGDGCTALHIAVAGGHRRMVREMVYRNKKLAAIFSGIIRSQREAAVLPVEEASRKGDSELVKLLYIVTPLRMLFDENDGKHGASVLKFCIHRGIWGIALDMLRHRPSMATTMDANNFNAAIQLSLMSTSFPSGSPVVFYLRTLYSYIRVRLPDPLHPEEDNFGMSSLSNTKQTIDRQEETWCRKFNKTYHLKMDHMCSLELLTLVCQHVSSISSTPAGLRKLEGHGVCEAFHKAVENGIVEFVEEAAKACPALLYKVDDRGRNAFMTAVEYRQEQVFNLLYSFHDRAAMLSSVDREENSMLHVAAMLSPCANLSHISGAALQMQRELQWFQELGHLMDPMYRDKLNCTGETAKQVFVRTHLELATEGQQWMKEMATACSVVGALIITIMFTAALTVPGGNKDTGLPTLLDDWSFKIFMISDAISLYAASTSVLMFLAILTARYSMTDFLRSLPTKMVIGLSTLFVSIAAMMVTFSATVVIVMDRQLEFVVPMILLAAVPVTLFMLLQFPLLIEIVMSTYGPSIFNRNLKPWL